MPEWVTELGLKFKDPLKQEFLQIIQKYDLRTVKFCEAFYSQFFRGFNAE